MKSPIKIITDFYRTWRRHRTLPLRLEFVLTDYCNLNCKGCGHYSSVAPKEFESLDELRRDAGHLGRVCADVPVVYLIGGETLLYPHLPESMQILREAFPNARIELFTNGLLLGKMPESFWEAARKYKVVMSITRYPIKFDYDAVVQECQAQGVEYMIFADRGEDNSFFRFGLDPHGRQNARLSHFKCFNFGCVSIKNSRIYPCSISACVSNLNGACGTNFEHRKGDYLEVSDVRSSADILRLRNNPVPFCRYCKPRPTVVTYGPSKRTPSEWVD